ncbi:hypothetical protein MKW98_017844 [Papaver atlanticum]|uniref:Actin cross-linking n=1 Tax=Papaver atlanticum TaxID=357466 RepID=A0AAD4XV79_9MAGN|nr:hypothetical protein MKW98_017844 [Papaver atlanticum]
MEFFTTVKAVRLRSHLRKYLVAEENEKSIRQSRQGSCRQAKWTVELVEGNSRVIRLKSCYGKYLSATDKDYVLGMTGKRVIQAESNSKFDSSIEWEPSTDGFQMKLKSWSGKYLRANGTALRGAITHDALHESSNNHAHHWLIEKVDELTENNQSFSYECESPPTLSSHSSFSEVDSPKSPCSTMATPKFSSAQTMDPKINFSTSTPTSKKFGMELFHNAKAVRLRSHHEKYLIAEEDEETVTQDRNGSTKTARWVIEFIDGGDFIRLKSCYGKYLTASNDPFLLGMTGRKVTQSLPRRLDSSIEWEPIRDGYQIKLKTRHGNFLRANGSVPPWRNSVTHDIPKRSKSQELLLWDVDILEIQVLPKPIQSVSVIPKQEYHQQQQQHQNHHDDVMPSQQPPDSPPSPVKSPPKVSRLESSDSSVSSSASVHVKSEGRMIYFRIANEDGDDIEEEEEEEGSFTFKGNGVEELTLRLEEETGLEDIMVCTKSVLNGKLYPMRLHLPPNNATMHVVVVQASSKAARDIKPGLL